MSKRTNYDKIKCADCGGEAKAPNKFTKFCATCRLGKGALWHDGRKQKCECGRRYIAWNGSSAQRTCGQCFEDRAKHGTREAVEGQCRKCMEQKWLFSEHIPVCFACIDRPEYFTELRRAILKVVRRLTAAKNSAIVEVRTNDRED